MGTKRGLLGELDRLEDIGDAKWRPFDERMKRASELRSAIGEMGGKLRRHGLWTLVFDAPANLPATLPEGWKLDGKTLTVRY
jgi:hypothetical protein